MPSSAPSTSTNAENCGTGPGKDSTTGLPASNLLAAIIIYWNTLKLGDAVFARRQAGLEIPAELLAHVSPLGWEHLNLTGEYRWPGADRRAPRNA